MANEHVADHALVVAARGDQQTAGPKRAAVGLPDGQAVAGPLRLAEVRVMAHHGAHLGIGMPPSMTS